LIKVIFACTENQNEYEEEMEFSDETTDEEIEEEYKDWVWNQIEDRFYWKRANS
jgi:hypothetical protein